MIILAYYECVLRVQCPKSKRVYEYTDVLPRQYKAIERFLKHKHPGRAWQSLKHKDCYVAINSDSTSQYIFKEIDK